MYLFFSVFLLELHFEENYTYISLFCHTYNVMYMGNGDEAVGNKVESNCLGKHATINLIQQQIADK